MPPIPINLGVQSNPGRYGPDGAARLINCFAEYAGTEGKIQWPLYAVDGFTSWLTLPAAARQFLNVDDTYLYVVAGAHVYRVAPDGTYTTCTGSVSSSGFVTMARNRRDAGIEIGIVTSDGHYYVLNTGTQIVTEQTIPTEWSVTPVQSITVLDGYFILFFVDGTFGLTGIDNATSMDGLLFANAESSPDAGVQAATRDRDLLLLGANSTEFWNDTGSGDFPFSRSGVTQMGIIAPQSFCKIISSVGNPATSDSVLQDCAAWLGSASDGSYAGVVLLQAHSGPVVSTNAVDRSVLAEPDISTIQGFSWSDAEHVWYAITGSTFTWVYDVRANRWHERTSAGLPRWRINNAVRFAGKTIVSDYSLPKLYWMNRGMYDEDGADITMTIQPPAVHAWPNRMRFYSMHIDVVTGVGLASGSGDDTDPQITLQHSNDNGITFSSPRTRSIGRAGEGKVRVKFTRLGQSLEDGKLFKIQMVSRTIRGITGAAVEAIKVHD